MPIEPPKPPEETGLIIQRGAGLVTLAHGSSSAMSEIISRSLAQIRKGRALEEPERRAGEECKFEIAPGVGIIMCWIPPGEFLMGSPEAEVHRRDNECQHQVLITKGFWLAKTLITQAQWQTVMGSNPSRSHDKDLPVDCVSWLDICGDETRIGGFLGAVNKLAPMHWRFDLPTEAQWEYACRAGAPGLCAAETTKAANHRANSDGTMSLNPDNQSNCWGLQEMPGHVIEWCMDWYDGFATAPVVEPSGSATGSSKVGRGGNAEAWCHTGPPRIAIRGGFDPHDDVGAIEFRLALNSILLSRQEADLLVIHHDS